MDKKNSNSLLGYEIFRDGKPISFTSTNSFTDKDINTDVNHEYTIIAYDNELNTTKPYKFNLHEGRITSNEKVMVGLNTEFNPLDFVSAKDYKGNSISDKIETVSNNVDTTKKAYMK